MDAEAVLAAVRKAASPRVWSSGVSIARGQRVLYEGQSGNEVTLRVTVPAQPVPHVVVIDVVDHAWSCDCPSREDQIGRAHV